MMETVMFWTLGDSVQRYSAVKWTILGTGVVGYSAIATTYESTVGEADHDARAPST